MNRRQRLALLAFLALFLIPALVPWQDDSSVTGRGTDARGPVAGARVRWQGQPTFVLSDAGGRFRLPVPTSPTRRVTAHKPGYRIAVGQPVDLRLEPLPAEDAEDYTWLSPHPDLRQPSACGNCHDAIYREWAGSAHAHSARNPKLLQLIADPDGRSPPGWDLSAAHPLGTTVCATCHAPTFDAPELDDDLRRATGVPADGVHCDYCHKVKDAPTDKLGLRFGRDGLILGRPRPGDLLFYGPLEDAVRAGESFAQFPLYKASRACASCHEGVVFGVHVYGTYTEWLASPARAQGVQCQGCHMTPTGRLTNIAPGHGGIERDPATLASHRFPGGQAEMLRRCLDAQVQHRREGGKLRVDVTLRADHVGHRVPTGFIDRHLLLVVQAFDHAGAPLPTLDGPVLAAEAGTWARRPGRLYGKILRDEAGGGPLPFWAPGSTLHDNRLTPGQADRTSYLFPTGTARVEVRLWYRRFWQAVADARGWTDNDVLVLERDIAP